MSHARPAGFALLEVLLAMTILVVGVVAIAALTVAATRANTAARATTSAALMAAQKMEQLRALAWALDAAGAPITDTATNLTVYPPSPIGGVGLTASPADALAQNTDGYCDFLDANGRWVGGGTAPPAQTSYVRRWSIEPMPSRPDAVVLQVRVMRNRPAAAGRLLPDEAAVVTVKTRKAM